jgi:branched-chain amino acid transport system ATP-binding protein
MTGTSAATCADAGDPVLAVRDLSSGYGRSTVVRKVNLEVRRGSVTALLGPNGAGKTTLLSTISGLLAAQAGQVMMGGRDVTAVPADRRARLGLCHIPQGRGVYRTLTVRENLLMQAPRGRGRERECIERAATTFPVLAARIGQRAGTMSGGEQQMLAVGRGLMLKPRLLMLDEPSLGLAPVMCDVTFEKIAEIHKMGTAILLVEQNVSRALTLVERAYVLESGKVILDGSSAALANNKQVQAAYLGI